MLSSYIANFASWSATYTIELASVMEFGRGSVKSVDDVDRSPELVRPAPTETYGHVPIPIIMGMGTWGCGSIGLLIMIIV